MKPHGRRIVVCAFWQRQKAQAPFEDGRSAKGVMISFGARGTQLNEDGTPKTHGFIPFCYATKDGKARCDKFVSEKKLFPKNYIPMPGDMVNIEFELGKSDIVSVTKLDDKGNSIPITK